MLKHFYILTVSTFAIGLLSGAFVYFMTRPPIEPKGPETIAPGTFEVVVDMYGGCSKFGECSSYRISEDGKYTYVTRSAQDGDKRKEGVLQREQIATLKTLLEKTDLNKIGKLSPEKTCPPGYNGTAYRYEIQFGGVHVIDSCSDNVSAVMLFEALNKYFQILQDSPSA